MNIIHRGYDLDDALLVAAFLNIALSIIIVLKLFGVI
jgi:hypothetical protein